MDVWPRLPSRRNWTFLFCLVLFWPALIVVFFVALGSPFSVLLYAAYAWLLVASPRLLSRRWRPANPRILTFLRAVALPAALLAPFVPSIISMTSLAIACRADSRSPMPHLDLAQAGLALEANVALRTCGYDCANLFRTTSASFIEVVEKPMSGGGRGFRFVAHDRFVCLPGEEAIGGGKCVEGAPTETMEARYVVLLPRRAPSKTVQEIVDRTTGKPVVAFVDHWIKPAWFLAGLHMSLVTGQPGTIGCRWFGFQMPSLGQTPLS